MCVRRLRNGLMLESQGVKNPYQFGFAAASDTHVAGTSDDEETFFSKAGLLDGVPERRGSVPVDMMYGTFAKFLAPDTLTEVEGRTYTYGGGFESWSASGVTGVWAEENTRDAMYDAFRRKETFRHFWPAMRVRFFAGTITPRTSRFRDHDRGCLCGGCTHGWRAGENGRCAHFYRLGQCGSAWYGAAATANHQGLGKGRRDLGEGLRLSPARTA